MDRRVENVLLVMGTLGVLLMGYRAATGTQPGTFPGEPWPCECECPDAEVAP